MMQKHAAECLCKEPVIHTHEWFNKSLLSLCIVKYGVFKNIIVNKSHIIILEETGFVNAQLWAKWFEFLIKFVPILLELKPPALI